MRWKQQLLFLKITRRVKTRGKELLMKTKTRAQYVQSNVNKHTFVTLKLAKSNMSEQEPMMGCSHYKRKCQIEAPCCKDFYWCRFCHNEAPKRCKVDEMDRHAVKRIKCMLCQHEQIPKQTCEQCNEQLAKYFCGVCNLFVDSATDVKIYHCNECGICRVGKREDYEHCPNCDMCVGKGHECKKSHFRNNCPVCLEDLFTSRESSVPLPCSHVVHAKCQKEMLKNRLYKCPVCSKAIVELDNELMDEEIRNTQMPEEYRNLRVKILCNECSAKTTVPFHIFGLKCGDCGSYNTVRTMGAMERDPNAPPPGDVPVEDEGSWEDVSEEQSDDDEEITETNDNPEN
jgi:RING finger/CHY zinc finger protein 1